MAIIKLYRDKLRHNFDFLKDLFEENHIEWGVVTKLLCGNELLLKEVLGMGVGEVHDSRISNLKKVKKLAPNVQTVYIKPPPKRSIPRIIQYADVSLNTELGTMKMLSAEAVKQDRKHKVLIMVEMGDLREGVMGEDLLDFYDAVFRLPNISVVGLGTNLNCLNGVMPSMDKLVQLSLYKQIIELKFNRKIPWVSGGTSVAIPLLYRKQLPRGVNHFRVGETLYFGLDLFSGKTLKGMKSDIFELFAEIIEVTEKPLIPHGQLGENPYGERFDPDPDLYGKTTTRIILDVGSLDVNPKFLHPVDKGMEFAGISSDMLILNLGKGAKKYKVGDLVRFRMKYMGALQLLNSDYIEKVVE